MKSQLRVSRDAIGVIYVALNYSYIATLNSGGAKRRAQEIDQTITRIQRASKYDDGIQTGAVGIGGTHWDNATVLVWGAEISVSAARELASDLRWAAKGQ